MDGRFANVIVNISHENLDRPFQYLIPDKLRGKLSAGDRVRIPFGKGNRLIEGYVLEITDQAEYADDKMKYIFETVTDSQVVETRLIKLAWWMKVNYGTTMIQALKTVLPIKKKVKEKEEWSVVLRLSQEEAADRLAFFRQKHQSARERLVSELMKEGSLPGHIVTEKLQISSAVIRAMEEQQIIRKERKRIFRNVIDKKEKQEVRKTLNEWQKPVADAIIRDYDEGIRKTYLIRGITGSGKTEIYMEVIEKVIQEGKQVILLIPEIALTYQTILRFYRRFGNRISTLHSRLSEGEKYDQFERAKNGDIDIMIGPRSALFTPFKNLGLIVIDEEHENSYKSDTMPKYHAREVAEKLAELYNASVIMGSATPSLEAYYKAKQGIYQLFELDVRANAAKLPNVTIADLREELKSGNRSIFSRSLQQKIRQRLQAKEQIMLFLNRRGYAGFVSCRACGHVMKCPHCDVSLSEHKNGKLICHYCGYEQPAVKICPSCGSKYILGFRAGTQQIEEQLKKYFPEASVLRMDADTTRKKGSYDAILSAFAEKKADILLGTQMIVKGHDFPGVTLVGILAADLSLGAGDYRAGERTFELLTQAAGRAGRGEQPGEVVIQTYQPEHASIQYASRQDYPGFYEEEIGYRQIMGYPPAAQMLAVLILSTVEEKGIGLAERMVKIAVDAENRVRILGPAAASIGKLNDKYRTVFYCKADRKESLIHIKDQLEKNLSEMELKEETIQFDFNPVNAY